MSSQSDALEPPNPTYNPQDDGQHPKQQSSGSKESFWLRKEVDLGLDRYLRTTEELPKQANIVVIGTKRVAT